MEIRSPCERVGKPLIGSNHMHPIACRKGDETSVFFEGDVEWILEVASQE